MSTNRETHVREQGVQQGKTYKRPLFCLTTFVLDAGCFYTMRHWHCI